MNDVTSLWVYLAETQLVWLFATLAAYLIGDAIFRRTRRAIANPVLIAILILSAGLFASATPYATYFEGAQFVHFLLGPATVALAVPLWANRAAIRSAVLPMAAALLAGSLTAVIVAIAVASAMGASSETLLSLAPKSATTPIAMGIAEKIGGAPALAAVLVILTGVIGAVLGPPLLNALKIRDAQARGFALGVASHGIGAARAFQEDERSGAFAGAGMGLNGLATVVIVPIVISWLL